MILQHEKAFPNKPKLGNRNGLVGIERKVTPCPQVLQLQGERMVLDHIAQVQKLTSTNLKLLCGEKNWAIGCIPKNPMFCSIKKEKALSPQPQIYIVEKKGGYGACQKLYKLQIKKNCILIKNCEIPFDKS